MLFFENGNLVAVSGNINMAARLSIGQTHNVLVAVGQPFTPKTFDNAASLFGKTVEVVLESIQPS